VELILFVSVLPETCRSFIKNSIYILFLRETYVEDYLSIYSHKMSHFFLLLSWDFPIKLTTSEICILFDLCSTYILICRWYIET
jgi:hypothetical protein